MSIYDALLERRVKRGKTPGHITLVITGADLIQNDGEGFETLENFFRWCENLGIEKISVYISLIDSSEAVISRLQEGLEAIDMDIRINSSKEEGKETTLEDTSDSQEVTVSIGIEGRGEFVEALREIAKRVDTGNISPEDVDEKVIEETLIFEGEPDIVLKTGGEHLSDFMIWQSVYSELYFADYNWQNFRKRDLLRSVRDFQKRERRYGK